MRSCLSKAFVLLLLLTVAFLPPERVFADTLFLSPVSGSYTVGQTLTIRVLVSTPSRSVNAISGNVIFPRDQMQVTSVSKSGSIMTLWVVEPAFSNSVGSVSFEGVVPNPGYIGSSGTVLTINFRVTAPGAASVRVASGSILANDGQGTNVLRTLGTSSFTFTAVPPPTEPSPAVEDPADIVEVPIVEPDPVVTATPELESERFVVEENLYDMLVGYIGTISGSLLALLVIVVLLVSLLMYGRSRFIRLRAKVRRETYDVEKVLHHSFDTLKEDITACVGLLERAKHRRSLTEEERAVVSLLKQHLRQTESLVTKEIHDIRRHAER